MGVREAARAAGVSPSTVTDWRSGSAPDDYMAVSRLAKELGVTLSFLLTGSEDHHERGRLSLVEVLDDGGIIFDGICKVTVQRLVPKKSDVQKVNNRKGSK